MKPQHNAEKHKTFREPTIKANQKTLKGKGTEDRLGKKKQKQREKKNEVHGTGQKGIGQRCERQKGKGTRQLKEKEK